MKEQVLEGVKIVDFTWAITGPAAARYLADHGATIIHVESKTKPDTLRVSTPHKDNVPGLDRAAYFANYNAGKYGITLNMRKPQAGELARQLIKWADIVVENYTTGVMERWGLGYEELEKIKPDIIMASTNLMGHSGPLANYRGYGHQATALVGFGMITGWPDKAPVGFYAGYTDIISYHYLAISLLIALEHRRRTGKGLHIEQSQSESSLTFISSALLDYAVNGRIANRQGNRDDNAAPHGAYRCRGNDRWCVIGVFSEQEWDSFRKVVSDPWTGDARFATFHARKKNEDELDRLVEGWTVNYTPEEVTWIMQSKGVPAGVVETAEDMHRDVQFKHRKHFKVLNHPVIGPLTHDTPAFKLSETPAELRMPSPCMGEHNKYVFTQILGLSDEEFARLSSEGVFD